MDSTKLPNPVERGLGTLRPDEDIAHCGIMTYTSIGPVVEYHGCPYPQYPYSQYPAFDGHFF